MLNNIFPMDKDVIKEVENDVYGIKNYLQDGKWILDVGAHIGSFSAFAIKQFPNSKIIAIEPEPRNFNLLNSNVGSVVQTEQVALTDIIGEVEFCHFGVESSACHSIYDIGAKQFKVIKVSSVTLKFILEKYNIEELHLLKLDCQGAEFPVLLNTETNILNKIEYIAMEAHWHIANTQNILGAIPNAKNMANAMFVHLNKTHSLIQGEECLDSIQVWKRRTVDAS